MDRVHSLRKIPTRLRGTNFCTSSACFLPNSVRQPNGPKCAQIVLNAPKHWFRVQWGGSGVFLAKNSDATSWHELLHYFGFAPNSVRQPNSPKCAQIIWNIPKHQFTVQWGGSGAKGWIGCVRCKKFQCDFTARNFALIAPVQPIFYRASCSNETIQNAHKHYEMLQYSLGCNRVDRVRSLRKILMQFHCTNLCINCTVQPVLHRVSCSNEILPNTPKH